MENFIEEIEHLPPLPKTLQELEEAYMMDDYTAKDIEDIIKKDPLLVADILKVANSGYYGLREVHDIRQAIVLFGMDQLREFAMLSFLRNSIELNLDFYGINEDIFIQLSILKAQIARILVTTKGEKLLVGNAAFLADVGKVLLSQYASKKGIKHSFEDMPLNEIDKVEKELLGLDTIEVTIAMFKKWEFDQKLIELLKRFKTDDEPLPKALFIAREAVTLYAHLALERLDETSKKKLKPIAKRYSAQS